MSNGTNATAQGPVSQEEGFEPLSIDQAFQQLLDYLGSPGRARHRLDELFRTDLQLWGRLASSHWFAVPNSPTFFDHHLLVEAREGPDGWHAGLAMQEGKIGVDDFMETEWAASRKEFEALLQRELEPEPPRKELEALLQRELEPEPTKGLKRGPKGYETWELFKVKFFLLVHEDLAGPDINIERYSDKLLKWGEENLGENKTPKQTRMRDTIRKEWLPLWRTLLSLKE